MDKKKIILTSLASVAMLGSAFIASQPSVVKAAEETTAQNEILANFDQALEETIKELEEEAKNDPGSAESIKETIAKLKAEAAKERAKIEDGFKTGKTAEATENEIEEIAKKEEAEEEEAAKAEEAAQKEFLANFDKALEDAIAELKKADTQNNPELAKQVAEAITKLKEEAAKQKKEDLSDEEIAAVKKFFNTQPQFIFTPTLTNKKGKLAGNLDFSIANSDFENLLAEGKTFNLFNHFIFKVDVNKEALVEQVATGLQSLSLDKEQATKMAATEVEQDIKQGVQQGILVDDGKQVKLDLVLEKGELKLNGQVIPEEQVFSILFLAMMSMGQ